MLKECWTRFRFLDRSVDWRRARFSHKTRQSLPPALTQYAEVLQGWQAKFTERRLMGAEYHFMQNTRIRKAENGSWASTSI